MIDTDKYEGHTPALWNLTPEGHIVADDMTVVCNKHTKRIVETNHKDIQLIADAPLLLEEVKRLTRIEAMLKKNNLWVSQEGWEDIDRDDELLVSIDFLIQGFQELRGDLNET